MKRLLMAAAACLPLWALAAEGPEEIKKDIQRHKAMAVAHGAAAKCLDSGKNSEQCQKELQAAGTGLALGKYCGMKHDH